MVDPEHLALIEDLAYHAAEPACTGQVVPDRLLEDDPGVGVEPGVANLADDRGEGRRRRGAIEEPPTLGAELRIERHQALANRSERGCVVQWRGHVGEGAREGLPTATVDSMASELLHAQPSSLAEVAVVDPASAGPDDRVALGQLPLVREVVQRRKELAVGQVA